MKRRTYPAITATFEARYWRILDTPEARSRRASERNKALAKERRRAAAELRSEQAKAKAAARRKMRRMEAREREDGQLDRRARELLREMEG